MRRSARNWTSGAVLAMALAMGLAAAPEAHAQRTVRIWEVPLGTPATQVPSDFVLPACGTHGGPPGIPLKSFAEFSRCRPEPGTGLREVWFSYDDDQEYFLRAVRADAAVVERYRANQMLNHVVVYSLLFDQEGRLQGYRISTDPREPPAIREEADAVGDGLRAALPYRGEWDCKDLPPPPGAQPWGGKFENLFCEKTASGVYATMTQHLYLKAGQQLIDRGDTPLASEFEAGTWVEVINANLVGKVAPK
jgi:hypothetical protein